MTALLQFFISYGMAMLAFWLLEISTFIFILFAFEYLASGHLFPLDMLPPLAQHILAFTPFPYQLYFPVSVYLGRSAGPELYHGLLVQFGWGPEDSQSRNATGRRYLETAQPVPRPPDRRADPSAQPARNR